jgi:hypothetical protein
VAKEKHVKDNQDKLTTFFLLLLLPLARYEEQEEEKGLGWKRMSFM